MFSGRLVYIIGLYFLVAYPGMAQTPLHPQTKQDPLKDSIDTYYGLKQYPKAISFAEQWVAKTKRENGDQSPEYARSLHTLGFVLTWARRYGEAYPLLHQSLEIRKKVFGETHPDVAGSITNIGLWHRLQRNYAEAIPLYIQGLEIRRKTLDANHKDLLHSLVELGKMYLVTYQNDLAISAILEAMEIQKKSFGEKSPERARSLNNLGIAYLNQGDYYKAESALLQALELAKLNLGENSDGVAAAYLNLGALYSVMGNKARQEVVLRQTLEIKRKIHKESDPEVGLAILSLGTFFLETGIYENAESYLLQAKDIFKSASVLHFPFLPDALTVLGQLYMKEGKYAKSQSFFTEAQESSKKIRGERSPLYAECLRAFGDLYATMGHYQKGDVYYQKALEIQNSALHAVDPGIAITIATLGKSYFSQGQLDKAESLFLDWDTKKQGQIQRYFPFLSGQEKEKFFESQLSPTEDVFKSFCVDRYSEKKSISTHLYNDQLATKGLLLNSSAKWKHRIKTSGDKKLNRLFVDWEIHKNHLSKLLQSTDSNQRAGIDSVQAIVEKMEKELSLRSENFAKLADKKLTTWKEVQKTLKPGEAAIEMVRVKKFGISKTVTDTSDPKKPTYQVKGLTDTIYYAALIIKPESLIPEMVLLKNGNDLEGKHLNFYQNSISKKIPDNQSYQQFWEKIGAKLGTTTRVYFSPDGVFHTINLNTLFNPRTKKYLLEEKDIRMVTGTKDLVNPSPVEEENKLAELVGFPNYYSSGPTASISTSERKSPEMSYGLQLELMGTLADLPATKEEVDKISSILKAKGWDVKNYTGAGALEQNIKEAYKPRLLHIATHGFFQPDTTDGSNPLLRSGLMLAGAGSTLMGEKNETGEDGILTAYEAMNLNLDNTDLVVLSACETGLGEIKNGEGVYGLQRAFKVAGAKSIIMSLWKVNDEATQELMVSFYKHWLGSASDGSKPSERLNKRTAFLKAQKELKAKYPNPYYWGAFVMVGE